VSVAALSPVRPGVARVAARRSAAARSKTRMNRKEDESAMPSLQETAELLDLKRRIEKLSLGDQLRVAAACLDDGKYDMAETLAGKIVDELRIRRIKKRV
jgi:hypothetical protein